jgi:hypothetical protein
MGAIVARASGWGGRCGLGLSRQTDLPVSVDDHLSVAEDRCSPGDFLFASVGRDRGLVYLVAPTRGVVPALVFRLGLFPRGAAPGAGAHR